MHKASRGDRDVYPEPLDRCGVGSFIVILMFITVNDILRQDAVAEDYLGDLIPSAFGRGWAFPLHSII